MFEANQCGEESRHVFSVLGEDVTLPAGYGANTAIIWVKLDDRLDKTAIAETEPGKPILIKKDGYNGRLKAAADGSLIIINVTRFQSGHYGAFIERQQSLQCVQDYHLFVYSMFEANQCGEESRHVFSVPGEDVTLPAGYGANTAIIWVKLDDWLDKTAIAETEPGKPVLIKKDRYNGRLKAAADGSLIITNVTGFQRGHYGAFIERQQSLQCVQDYHLSFYHMRSIPACGEKIAVSGIEGGEVTLPMVQTDIREVTWSTLVDHMDEISPETLHKEELTNKRLKVTPHGDLILTKLTREDSGSYVGHFERRNYFCIQLYDLTVNNYSTLNIIRLVFSILLVFLICGIFIDYMRSRKIKPSRDEE
ncbi:uncharacterized protein LOC143942056 [Lithobates pipiens]